MAIAPGSYSFMGGAVLGKGSEGQFVLVRSGSLLTAFTDDEYNACLEAVYDGKAVCVQYKIGPVTLQTQLLNVTGLGDLQFVDTSVQSITHYRVAGTSPHTVSIVKTGSAQQFVLERDDMSTAFTASEYLQCQARISEGTALCVQWKSGSARMQAQLSGMLADGSLLFSFTTVDLEMLFIVDGSTPHSISTHTNDHASGFIPKGEATVATLNALTGQENGWFYTLTDAGTLTEGSLAVVAGDTVAWNGFDSVWYKALNYAPARYGTDQVPNLPVKTAFAAGDKILVCGASPHSMDANIFLALMLSYVNNNSALPNLTIVANPEYVYAIEDTSGTFLFGIKDNGSIEWAKGIPEPVRAEFNQVIDRINTLDSTVMALGQICSHIHITSNEEFVYAVVDENDTFLFGITEDGSVNWSKGLPSWLESRLHALESAVPNKVDKIAGKSLIDSTFAGGVSVISNEEFIMAVTDSNGAFLFGIRKDGTFDWVKGIPQILQIALSGLQADVNEKVDKVVGKSLIDDQFASHTTSTPSNPEWFWALLDVNDKLVEGITQDGIHVFKTPVRFDGGISWSNDNLNDLVQALKDIGFTGGAGDWSDAESLEIPVPEMAVINFTNISQMPQTKTTDAHAIMEFWDMNGNYFKKKVIANAQGSSSLSAPKKNISIDICNDEWIGDDTFKIKFGAWVPQDSFHIKAYYTDFFRCVGLSGYDLVKKILDTRVPNTTWKKALNYGTDPVGQKSVSPQVDSGALCYPQGFVCKVYLNGVFEGLFCWQLKKHRDNYNLDKKTAENIHIEGMLGGNFFGGTIDWTAFEIRNPKDLITYSGTKYDGDNPAELIDSTSPAYDSSNSKHKLSAKVKQYIINLSNRMAQIGNDPSIFQQYFDVDSCVDYAIMSDVIYNYDYVKNIQWTTWDGVKWFVNPYDLDSTLGANSAGDGIHYPTTSHVTTATNHPLTFVLNHYTSELEQRWKELRDAHIIDAQAIAENLEHYVRLFGKNGYKAEYNKWTNAPCNRDPVFDTDNWDLERDADGNPVIYTTQYHDWNGTQTYAPGYVVQYNLTGSSIGNFGWWFRFTAKQTNINKPPITQRGFKDNIFRVYNWLNQQISNMDTVYHYT